MTISKFAISGMTCQACVEKITIALKKIPGVTAVTVQLTDGSAIVQAASQVELASVKESLANYPKYNVSDFSKVANSVALSKTEVQTSKLETYKPLVIVFGYVFLVSAAFQIYHGSFHPHLFMNHIMGGFFIGLSFFKVLSLKAFADSFSSYDPIAKKVSGYGIIYPFIEIALGLMFIANMYLLAANIITIVILSATTFGVIKRLQSKTQIQCACLGTAFNLPLSFVTVAENGVMIAMAAVSLYW